MTKWLGTQVEMSRRTTKKEKELITAITKEEQYWYLKYYSLKGYLRALVRRLNASR